MAVELQQISTTASITAISWTGGKDCNLCPLMAWRNPDLNVKYLLTFRPENKPFRAHPTSLMEKQASSIGLELMYIIIPEATTDYMQAYVDGMRDLKERNGISVIATGDMDLVGTMQRNWIERCCEKVEGMTAFLPLWNIERETCLNKLLSEGFEIIFSCVKSPFFDGTWINRILNEAALAEMRILAQRDLTEREIERGTKPLDLCGERGEYHTMCVDGPLYRTKVVLNVNAEPMKEVLEQETKWKGNIHNADILWTISVNDT